MQQNTGPDRSQLLTFLIFSLVLIGGFYYFQSKDAQKAALEAKQGAKIEKTADPVKSPVVAAAIPDSVSANAISTVNIEGDQLKLAFSTLGGQLSTVELKEYKAYDKKTDEADLPLELIKNNNSSYGFEFKDKSGKTISTRNLIFVPQIDGNKVTMTSSVNGATIQFVYTLLPKYTVDFQVKTQGLSRLVSANTANFIWDYQTRELEKGRTQEQSHSEFSYAFNNFEDYDCDARTGLSEPDETLNWLGVKQQFFSSIIESKAGFTQSTGNQETIDEGEYLKKFAYNGTVAMHGGEFNQDFTWYFMPLDIDLLKSYDGKNFDEILPLGWSFIGGLNRYVFIPMYKFIAKFGIPAGWVIFLMTIIVKLILSPVMFKQHKLSAMMRVIRPEIDEVNKKYKEADAMKRQQETMAVYRKAGVNQMAGCLPALLQIPLFYALFRFFPNFIELRGKSFWFAKDLTAFDDVIKLPFHLPILQDHLSIFALACTAVILIYTLMTSGNIQQPTMEGLPNMKVIMYIFPITFIFFLNTSASGLSWYYFVSNAINILIILVIKYWILDEKKIHAQIQINKEKPKKEGKFQKRMREMMEKAQEQQRVQQEQVKKQKNKK